MENKEQDKPYIINTKLPVRMLGGSYYLLLSREVRKQLDVKNGTVLGVKMWNIPVIHVICPKCGYEFIDEADEKEFLCVRCDTRISNIPLGEIQNEKEVK